MAAQRTIREGDMEFIDDFFATPIPPQIFVCEAGHVMSAGQDCAVVRWNGLIDLSFGMDSDDDQPDDEDEWACLR
jgi:hypothetical protein